MRFSANILAATLVAAPFVLFISIVVYTSIFDNDERTNGKLAAQKCRDRGGVPVFVERGGIPRCFSPEIFK